MLAYHHRPVCLCFLSTDLPILSTIETAGTLYQKDQERFHLILTQPEHLESDVESETNITLNSSDSGDKQLLWLEISPYRVIMTMQNKGKLGYRHFWESGIYGTSRYWLHSYDQEESNCFRLRNFTRSLKLKSQTLPESLRIEYELWSGKVQLGYYVLHLDIHH